MIGSLNQVKSHNVELVRSALKSIPYGTKNTVAKITGLSIATCNTILNELAATGEIVEIEGEAPSVGRPPKTYRYNEDFAYICCLFPTMEEGVRRLTYAITDLQGKITEDHTAVYEQITAEVICRLVEKILQERPRIRVVSFGVPGYYHDDRIRSCGIPELEGIDIVGELKKTVLCEVVAENDMNAMAYGLYYYGDEIGGEHSNMVLIACFKGRNLGSGIIVNGQILRGHTDFAGEIDNLAFPSGQKITDMMGRGEEGLLQAASTAVTDFSAIVNPAVVIFTGENMSEELLPRIEERVLYHIPKAHIPKLLYGRDFWNYYVWGLSAIALEKTNL